MIKWFLGKIPFFDFFSAFDTSRPQQMVDIQYNIIVMSGRELSRPYRVWFFAEGERFLSFWRCHRPRKRAALGVWCGWFKPQLEIRHATALTAGAKHWHRQKAVFYVFCFGAPSIYPLNRFFYVLINWNNIFFDYICTLRWIKSQNYKFKHQQLWKRHLRVSFLH